MKSFDMVMVLEYFRPVTYYLSIIRYLSADFNIAIYTVDIPNHQIKKNKDAQDLFIKMCIKFGAKVINKKEIETKLLLIPQNTYTDIAQKDINKNIKSYKKIGILGFAWAGVKIHDEFLDIFSIDKFFVIDKNFVNFLLEQRDVDIYKQMSIIETGLPFKKYPIFENLQIDYLLVMPTSFSFAHEKDKWQYLETIKTLFSQIDNKDTIIHKPHNGMYTDLFATEHYMKLIRIIRYIPMFPNMLKASIKISSGSSNKIISKLYTAYLYYAILNRTIPLSSISEHSSFAVEAFFPFVKKGVIGGLSNTIWGTLYHQIPFYNAVNLNLQNRFGNNKIYGNKDTSNHIDLNLRYFYIPYCENKLEFDSKYFSIVNNSTRNADLINQIKNELQNIDEKDKPYIK
ncbi:hypothetical protein N9W55_02975 [Amylibacter sp.]|nr:hypothetical protein [Amylibacter sp.]